MELRELFTELITKLLSSVIEPVKGTEDGSSIELSNIVVKVSHAEHRMQQDY